MPSFGEKLRLEREKRKITLEQISSTTKIGTRMLQALEEEKFSQLPGGIFNKGFVRAYARTLGLDEDQTVADYLEASGDAPPVRVESPTRENARDNTRANVAHEPESGRLEIRAEVASRQLPWGILAVVLLIIALGLSLWNYHRQQERLTSQSKPAPRASQIVEQSTSPAVAPGSAPQPSSVSEPMNPPPVATTPPSAEESLPTASQPLPNTAAATSAPAEFLVLLHARDESWVSVFVDGKPAGSETLEAGDERTFRGRQRVTVKAGNAAALDLRLNGRALPIVGDVGEVKTITIGPAGMIPGTASTPAP